MSALCDLLEQLLATMQREAQLRRALLDINQLDSGYQTLETAMDIAGDVLLGVSYGR